MKAELVDRLVEWGRRVAPDLDLVQHPAGRGLWLWGWHGVGNPADYRRLRRGECAADVQCGTLDEFVEWLVGGLVGELEDSDEWHS